MADHVGNRKIIMKALREELVGPSPQGEELDCSDSIIFEDIAKFRMPWKQKVTGEEILQRDRPLKRYGIGVLYPLNTPDKTDETVLPVDASIDATDPQEAEEEAAIETLLTAKGVKNIEDIVKRSESGGGDTNPYDLDLSSANTYRPSSIGISFLAEFPADTSLVVDVPSFDITNNFGVNGRYKKKKVQVQGKDREWWLRSPVTMKATFSGDTICATDGKVASGSFEGENIDGLDLRIEVFSRPHDAPRTRLLTVCLINRMHDKEPTDQYCLFQSFFNVHVASTDGMPHILPYPSVKQINMDEEDQSISLLYRQAETYAVGHGCAADWVRPEESKTAFSVRVECLPSFETPSITPDIMRKDGSPIEVSMAAIAGIIPGEDGLAALSEVIDFYEQWIDERKKEIQKLDKFYLSAATRHLNECSRCAKRMRDGFLYLSENQMALKAFKRMNYAMLLQQVCSRRNLRSVKYDYAARRLVFSEKYSEPDPLNASGGIGKWRAFQIAFLLMTVKSAAEGHVPDRSTVELIWFPTGGGKTEAYLGLASFAMFIRRLKDPADSGCHAIMRYTLRLLTTQQFQRASSLLCVMEYLRRKYTNELGEKEFSIGIWLGGANTPNTKQQALEVLRALRRGDQFTDNMFIVNKCPWCGAHMGPIKYQSNPPRHAPRVIGYEQRGSTVIFKCPDNSCEFNGGLPVYVIDQDIYENPPSLVIGTVDKFAMLSWRSEARALFGIGSDGNRICSPPGLIIQDELHLISGPLGSMVGLYETVIEELCTDRRNGEAIAPKIIASTATIRRYTEQIKALYGRNDVALFPPPGLDVEDSFFSRYARQPDGTNDPGRIYVGVHAPGLGSLQTAQVRTFTSLIQAPVPLSPEERDPWWTLLIFFNSFRELGTTLSLFQSDIPDYLKVLRNRTGMDFSRMRRLGSGDILELTGRIKSEEIPDAIAVLERSCTGTIGRPVDICLASSIIEVGIDIDRLSLISVVGQPKTTSQYIQVTGRVGRRWQERPGLVVTIYSASKPRDRSHFEKFRSYHERLYAQVEPTSVTPFSPPALDRALHSVIAAYVRQAGNRAIAESPYPCPVDLINQLRNLLLPRIQSIDQEEVANFERVFDARIREWQRWQRRRWDGSRWDEDPPLLREAGSYVSSEWKRISWPTQRSLRNVDAECQVEITTLYLNEGGEENA